MRNDIPAPTAATAALDARRIAAAASRAVDDHSFLQQLRDRGATRTPDGMPPTRRTGSLHVDADAETRRIKRRDHPRQQHAGHDRITSRSRNGFDGALRRGSRLAVDRPLLCGNQLLEAGTEATVETIFPKLRIRGDHQDAAATVNFDDAADPIVGNRPGRRQRQRASRQPAYNSRAGIDAGYNPYSNLLGKEYENQQGFSLAELRSGKAKLHAGVGVNAYALAHARHD